MKKFIMTVISLLYSTSVVAGTAVLLPHTVAAQASNQQVAAADNKDKKETKSTASKPVVYKYIAQNGDTYSQMARKAIQTYGLKNKIKMSQAKIIAAETWLTQAASSPYLNLSQPVEVPETTVRQYVEKAQKLNASEEGAWAAYTVGVNFNTTAVGQAS
jgi:hypothetical protein